MTEPRVPNNPIRTIRRVTLGGLFLNLFLGIFKCLAGYLGHSQAVLADGIHSFSDLVTDGAVLLGMRFWNKPADRNHPYGHQRIEAAVTLFIGLALGFVGAGLLWEALASLHGHHDIPPGSPDALALGAAVLSVILKEGLYRWTLKWGTALRSMALTANAWHHRSDALSSLPVVLAVGGTLIDPSWVFLDQLGAALVSVFILRTAWQICKDPFNQLIDQGVPEQELEEIYRCVRTLPKVLGTHKIRTRYLGSTSLTVDLHVEVDPEMTVREGHKIASEVKFCLKENFPDIVDVVVHIEPWEEKREASI